MLIEFKLKCRYDGKRFMPGEQANIPEEVAKRLVNGGAAFFVEKKVVFDSVGGSEEGDNARSSSLSEDLDDITDEELAKKIDRKFNRDKLKEAAMEVDIIVPSFDIKKGELIALIIEEGKAEEVLNLPDSE